MSKGKGSLDHRRRLGHRPRRRHRVGPRRRARRDLRTQRRDAEEGGEGNRRRRNCRPSRSTSPTRTRWRGRREIAKRHGRVDILVNSAGINLPKRNFKNVAIDGWNQIVAVNLPACSMRAGGAARHARAKDGLIINVSSWAGRYASALAGPGYNATKPAVIALTESINMEECMNGIRATSVLPGEVATPILEKRPVPPPPEERARMLQAEDLGKTMPSSPRCRRAPASTRSSSARPGTASTSAGSNLRKTDNPA